MVGCQAFKGVVKFYNGFVFDVDNVPIVLTKIQKSYLSKGLKNCVSKQFKCVRQFEMMSKWKELQ